MDYSEITEKINELEKLKQRLIWLEKSNTALVKEKERLQEYVDSAHSKVAIELQDVIKTLRSTYKYKDSICNSCGREKEMTRFVPLKKLSASECEKLEHKLYSVGNKLSCLLTNAPLTISNKFKRKSKEAVTE